MLRLEISDDVLVKAVSSAVEGRLNNVEAFTGYLDIKGACKYLSVGETQFKEWVRRGHIIARKVSAHLVRYKINELRDFMEQFKMPIPREEKAKRRVTPSREAAQTKPSLPSL